MASDIRIRVGTFTSTITFSATDAQVATVLRRFATDRVTPPPAGWSQAQQNQYYLDEALKEIVRLVRQEAMRVHLRELREAQSGTLQSQAETENNL